MRISKKWVRLCNIVCAVLMTALLVFQFMPFWTMPSCTCDHTCEVEVNENCAACSIELEWCAIPSACICEYTCRGDTLDITCPVCTRDSEMCTSKEAAPKKEQEVTEEPENTTADSETTEETETTVETETTEETETTVETETTEETETTVETETTEETTEEVEIPEVPYPTFGENDVDRTPLDVSIQEYTWTPTFDNCVGVNEYFDSIFTDDKGTINKKDDDLYMVKDIVLMPILVLFGTAFGVYFCFTKSGNSLISIFSLVVGVAGTIGYLTQPIFQMGALWQVHLALSIAIGVISLIPTVEYLIRAVQWFLPKKAQ